MTDDRAVASFRSSTHPTRREIVVSGAMFPLPWDCRQRVAAQSSTRLTTPEAVSVSLTINGARHALHARSPHDAP